MATRGPDATCPEMTIPHSANSGDVGGAWVPSSGHTRHEPSAILPCFPQTLPRGQSMSASRSSSLFFTPHGNSRLRRATSPRRHSDNEGDPCPLLPFPRGSRAQEKGPGSVSQVPQPPRASAPSPAGRCWCFSQERRTTWYSTREVSLPTISPHSAAHGI